MHLIFEILNQRAHWPPKYRITVKYLVSAHPPPTPLPPPPPPPPNTNFLEK